MTEDKRSIIQMVAGLIEQGKKNQDKIAYSKYPGYIFRGRDFL